MPRVSNEVAEANKRYAKEHTMKMINEYSEEIDKCISKTKVYDEDFKYNCKRGKTKFTFMNVDSVSAVLELEDTVGKKAVLNFADYKKPGGLFMEGQLAQEEALCRESFLYNVLVNFEDSYYAWNEKHLNKAMYADRSLYSPDILFETDYTSMVCDVITCAAPNRKVALRYKMKTEEENSEILRNRIHFIHEIAEDNKVEYLILGAFGCGVFHQKAEEVARDIKYEFANSGIKNIIIAVPGKGKNTEVFKGEFSDGEQGFNKKVKP